MTAATHVSYAADELASIAGADFVSFDVFDTLLSRLTVRPSDVFTLVRSRMNEHGRYLLPLDWTIARIEAEHRCYLDSTVGPDITIDDIYQRIEAELDLPSAVVEAAKAEELATELRVLRARPKGRVLFEAARRAGARILIVSDMYLPHETIETALRAAGYEGWERLIVSGYDKLGKYNGTAFRALRAEYPDARIVHVGDNRVSDVDRAVQAGIEGIHLPTAFAQLEPERTGLPFAGLHHLPTNPNHGPVELGLSIVAGMVDVRLDGAVTSVEDEIGYGVLGPLLVGFTQWLHHTAHERGTSRLAFLAREGRLMQQAYESYWGEDALASEYVFASRRMINFASIRERVSPAQLDFLVASGAPLTVRECVTRFSHDIPLRDIEQAAHRAGLTPDSVVQPGDTASIRTVFRLLEPDLVQIAHRERADVIAYLESVGLDRPDSAVVDIGWQGSIQGSLETLINPALEGYYLGLHDTVLTRGRHALHGFVDPRGGGADHEWSRLCILPGIEVIELLFANADHASVATVARSDHGFTPVYTDERLDERGARTIGAIQRAALEFVADHRRITRLLPSSAAQLSPETALTLLTALVTSPTAAQAKALGALEHDNSLGVVASPLGMPMRSRAHYRLRRGALRREFDSAWWKAGFVRNARELGIGLG